MTRVGWTHLTLRAEIYSSLKSLARERQQSVGSLISDLIRVNTGINTDRPGIDTLALNKSNQNLTQAPIQRTEPNQTVFGEREGLETVGSQMAGPRGPDAFSVLEMVSKFTQVQILMEPNPDMVSRTLGVVWPLGFAAFLVLELAEKNRDRV
jgi:hypothetical protein